MKPCVSAADHQPEQNMRAAAALEQCCAWMKLTVLRARWPCLRVCIDPAVVSVPGAGRCAIQTLVPALAGG